MELEDSQFEDSLELIAKFEDKCLKPLRTAKCKDLDMKKMVEIVEWAKLIDKLSSRMDPSFMKQTDRLFLGTIYQLTYFVRFLEFSASLSKIFFIYLSYFEQIGFYLKLYATQKIKTIIRS